MKNFLPLFSLFFVSNILGQTCERPVTDFGNNIWNVRVFQLTNLSDYRATNQYDSRNNYKGFYTQKIDDTGHFGARTTRQWAASATSRPNSAIAFNTSPTNFGTAYAGCNLTSQYFLFTHKRKGFPRNNYEFFFDVWDDRTTILLDGREISELVQFGNNRMGKYCVYLDENSEVEIRTDNSGGNMSQLSFRISPSTTTIVQSPDVSVCVGENLNISVSASTANGTMLNHLFSNSSWSWSPNTSANMVTNGLNTREATINTMNQGIYTFKYSGKFEECMINRDIQVTINSVDGDTSIFGNNTWNVYAFSNRTNTPSTEVNYLQNQLIFFGYYTQQLASEGDYGFNTTQIASGGWNANGKPSLSNTWQGCTMPSNDNFTYIHKRKGFLCATYSLKLTRRGENTKIYINGQLVAAVNSNECNSADCSVDLGQFNLDANSKIEVITNERTGASQAILQIIPIMSSQLAQNDDEKTCPVRGNEWVNFYEVNGRFLGAVRGLTPDADLGAVTMTAFVEPSNLLVPACTNEDNLTAVMQRHWVISPSIQGPGEVRLPYLDVEFFNLGEQSSISANPFDLVSYPDQTTIKLSRYSGPINVNASPFDNCQVGGTTIHEQSNSRFASAGFHYQDFIVPGFSEFWLHGSSTLTPLPTVLTNYVINCDFGETKIDWTTVVNPLIAMIVLERSMDGQIWEIIYSYSNNKPGVYETQFSIADQDSRSSYYRISMVDVDNKMEFFKVLYNDCKSVAKSENLKVYPNPAAEKLTVSFDITTVESYGSLILMDVHGQIISEVVIQVSEGNNSIVLDVQDLSKGVYFVRLLLNELKIQPVKVLIQ